MASRIIHTAISKIVTEQYNIGDSERFLFGSILPDAYAADRGTAESHLKISLCDGAKKTYDLDRFKRAFEEELKTDDLYKGYYLHLIQDLFFRDFVYNKYHWNPTIEGNVERLHRDYTMINTYIIGKYQLKNLLYIPENFHEEKINQLYPFDINQLRIDFESDFDHKKSGEYFFFEPSMADEFVQSAVDCSIKELSAINSGKVYADMYTLAWRNKV